MKEDLAIPCTGLERMQVYKEAEDMRFEFAELTTREKAIYLIGMDAGFFQGVRHQAKQIADNFFMKIVGFRP